MKKSNKNIWGILLAIAIVLIILKYLAIPLGIAGIIYIIYKYVKTKDKTLLVWAIAPVLLLIIGGSLNSEPTTDTASSTTPSSTATSETIESSTSSSTTTSTSSEKSVESVSSSVPETSVEPSSEPTPVATTEEQPQPEPEPAPEPPVAATEDRIVYVASHGKSEAYWYDTSNMPSTTKMENVITMTEAQAKNAGKHHSMKE